MSSLPLLFLLLVLAAYSHGDEKRIGREAAREHSSVEKPKFLAVHLHSSADAEHIAHTHGFRNRGKIGNITGHYLFEFTGSHKNEELKRHKHVLAHTPQESRSRVKRFMPSDLRDPLYSKQWHLHKDELTATNLNVNVEAVWKMGYSGKGVTIGIVDDGVVPNHPDLAANFNAEGSYDVNFGKQDPTPFNFDSHGTEAAGVAVAGINTVCGVGVAPLAKVSGIRVLARDPTDAEEAIALHYRMDINDIYTCSWGPTDDGHLEGPGPLAENAIKQAIEQGRGGKGTIFVWAAGNGARAQDNCNYDGYVNSKYTIAIGAVNSGGGKTWYSESCAALTAVVPSSGNSRYIITTDIPNPSNGGCSQSFGGTSAASPMAAGIVALMLEANPSLTWRDVQDVIIRSALTIDASHTSWGLNGAGLKFSHDYGFGLIDANATVTRALKHVNLPPYATFRSGRLPPFVGNKGQFMVEGHPNFVVEHVEAYVTSSGEQRGRTLITLKSPFGTLSQLMEPHNEVTTRIDNWRFTTLACWGENPNGLWTLELRSTVQSSALKLEAWELVVYGHLSS